MIRMSNRHTYMKTSSIRMCIKVKKRIVGTVPKSNIKSIKRGTFDNPSTQVHDC